MQTAGGVSLEQLRRAGRAGLDATLPEGGAFKAPDPLRRTGLELTLPPFEALKAPRGTSLPPVPPTPQIIEARPSDVEDEAARSRRLDPSESDLSEWAKRIPPPGPSPMPPRAQPMPTHPMAVYPAPNQTATQAVPAQPAPAEAAPRSRAIVVEVPKSRGGGALPVEVRQEPPRAAPAPASTAQQPFTPQQAQNSAPQQQTAPVSVAAPASLLRHATTHEPNTPKGRALQFSSTLGEGPSLASLAASSPVLGELAAAELELAADLRRAEGELLKLGVRAHAELELGSGDANIRHLLLFTEHGGSWCLRFEERALDGSRRGAAIAEAPLAAKVAAANRLSELVGLLHVAARREVERVLAARQAIAETLRTIHTSLPFSAVDNRRL